ncbi:MAG TPA: hypothetical protein VFJ72_02675 [Rubrobacteraceae bacterium]|nr:hypothetical protein [Rubrobacteraceae bacterium]
MFFGGAIVAFAMVAVLAFGGVASEVGGSNDIKAWGSFRFLLVGLAVGSAWLESAYVPSLPGWPVGAFLATAAYLTITGAENSAAGTGESRES